MLSDKKVCFIGGGAMAEALIRGLLAEGLLPATAVSVAEPNELRRQVLRSRYAISAEDPVNASQLVSEADVIILAVKPNQLSAAMHTYKGAIVPGQVLISILAGVRLELLRRYVPVETALVRAMPNTSAAVGLSATAISASEQDADALLLAEQLLGSVGRVFRVEEASMDAVTALAGSGPAYVYLLAEAMEKGGVAVGLDLETARELTKQTLIGAAQMILSQSEEPSELRSRVTSPGGTTMAGLEVLQGANFIHIMQQAIMSAAQRSRSLSIETAAADS